MPHDRRRPLAIALRAVLLLVALAVGIVAVFAARTVIGRRRVALGVLAVFGLLLALGELVGLMAH